MNIWSQQRVDISSLNDILLENGRPKVIPSRTLSSIEHSHMLQFCVENGIYQIPTEELISWLKPWVAGKKAIEIGAGHGTIAKALDIPATDSYMQTNPAVRAHYEMLGQKVIEPPSFVEKLEANEAVDKYKPEVVIGSWITQLYKEGDEQGSQFGVDEENMLSKIRVYILIGNISVHGDKRIKKLPNKEFKFDWLYSRGRNPELNRIWIWKGA